MHRLSVGGDFPGLVFAIGSVLIFLLAIPALWYVVGGALVRLRHLRRGSAVVTPRLRIGPVLQQNFHHFLIADLRGFVKSSPSAFLTGIRWSAILNQNTDNFATVRCGGAVQRSNLHGIVRDRGYIGALPDEGSRDVGTCEESRKVQSGESVRRPALRSRGIILQNFRNFVSPSCRCGFENIQVPACTQQQVGDL